MKTIIKRFDDLNIYELYDLMKLRFEVFVMEQSCLYQDIDGVDKNAYHLLCRNDDGELVGYLRIIDAGLVYDEIAIGRVVSSSKARGEGVGRIIMNEALRFVRDVCHQEAVRISAQEYLLKFYKSLGFEPVSEVYLEDDIPHVEMLIKF